MRYILLTILVALSMNINAKEVDALDNCSHYEEYARLVMEYRQDDVPMKLLMEHLNKVDPESNYPAYRNILIEAYEEISYITDNGKQRAVDQFANYVFLDCIKVLGGN